MRKGCKGKGAGFEERVKSGKAANDEPVPPIADKIESEPARRLKDFGPFPGLLTRDERRAIILSCPYDH